MISALASGFGGTSGAVLSIGASGVDYSYKDGYRDVFGNGQNLPKPLYDAGVDYKTSHFNQLGSKMISPGNLLGRRGANMLTHFGGVFIGEKIKN